MNVFADSWQTILDDTGRPLLGQIEFCEPGTTVLKAVYDSTGIPCDNPIAVNGRTTNQVLLDSGDYTIRYYRKVGTGYVEYKTEEYKAPNVDTNETVEAVDTIAELKDCAVEEGKVVSVSGYYNIGDCSIRTYYWNPYITQDDGGAYISSNNQSSGSWCLKVPGSYIDVRWFGDIPDTTAQEEVTSNLGQRANAADFANILKKDLYFSKGYYFFDGTTSITVGQNIICDKGVGFVIKENTTGTTIQCKELLAVTGESLVSGTGSYSLVADWLCDSWFSSSSTVASGARFGYLLHGCTRSALTYSNTTLQLIGEIAYPVYLSNCLITELGGHFTEAVTCSNMKSISDYWFPTDYDFSDLTISTGCDVKFEDCYSADNYVNRKTACGKSDYGDMHGSMVTINAYLKAVNGHVYISNVQGSINANTTSAGVYHIYDCPLGLNIYGLSGSQSLDLSNAQVCVDSQYLYELLAKDSQLSSTNGYTSGGIQCTYGLSLERSKVYTGLIAIPSASKVLIKDCECHGPISISSSSTDSNWCKISNSKFVDSATITYQATETTGCTATITGNEFATTMTVSATVSNSLFNMTIRDNRVTHSGELITLNRQNFADDESAHYYTYENNIGAGCTLSKTQTSWYMEPSRSSSLDGSANGQWCVLDGAGYGCRYLTEDIVADTSKYATACSLFHVGTDLTFIPFTLTVRQGSKDSSVGVYGGTVYTSGLQSFDSPAGALPKQIYHSSAIGEGVYRLYLQDYPMGVQSTALVGDNPGFTYTLVREQI